jgi:hypothetical protein
VEGLYHLGYLSLDVYEAHRKRYSEPLAAEEQPTKEQLAALAEEKRLQTVLEGALKEWDKLPTRVQEYHLKTASEHKTLPIAVQIIEKRNHALVKGACDVLNGEST